MRRVALEVDATYIDLACAPLPRIALLSKEP